MKTRLLGLLLATLAAAAPAQMPPVPTEERPFRIVRQDGGLDRLIDTAATPEIWGSGYGLTEGPLWVDEGQDGYLLFADLISNVIYKRTRDGALSIFLDKAGYSGDDIAHAGFQTKRGRMNVLLIGPNGLTMDRQGRVIWCASPDRTVMRLEKDGTRTVLAARYEGKRFGGPNDVVVTRDGAVWFTDSSTGMRDGGRNPAREIPYNGVFRVKDGKVQLVVSDRDIPNEWVNGITFSPDEKYLYLNFGFTRVDRYPVHADGSVGDPVRFIDGEGSDGMKVDTLGNLYTTTGALPGEVRITSPAGKRLGSILLPIVNAEPKEQICATNVAFGDPDSKGLYITACQRVYHLRLKVAGVRPRVGA